MDLESIYLEYFTAVNRYMLSLTRDPVLAEEITQETFFRALRGADSFRGESSLRVWLFTIARNIYLNEVKKQSRRAEVSGEVLEQSPSVPGEEPESRLLQKETSLQAHRALHRLKEPYKEVFSIRTFSELSFDEIGTIFGKSAAWARVTYYRARMMIKEELEYENQL